MKRENPKHVVPYSYAFKSVSYFFFEHYFPRRRGEKRKIVKVLSNCLNELMMVIKTLIK